MYHCCRNGCLEGNLLYATWTEYFQKVPCMKKKAGGEGRTTARIKKSYFLLAILELHYNHREINALTSICTIPIFLLPHQC